MSTTAQRRPPMNGFHRLTNRSSHPATVGPRVALPPMEAFTGAPAELILALTEWHDYAAKALEHARKQRHALDAAEMAGQEYRAALKEAVSKGTDPGKVRDKTAQHRAEAEAHAAAADAARSAQVRAGVTLGPLLEEHAPTLYAPCETELSKADAELRESLATVTASWRRWSAAFALRRWLSDVATNGTVPSFHGPDSLPAEVAQALAALDNTLGSLDRLKADEAHVTEHRATEAAAAAWARREYGTN